MTPVISVVMPVYNMEPYLAESIDSILKQNFSDFELIIINDGSTDQTGSVIKGYTDSRIRIIDNILNKGLVDSLNAGVEKATGKYIARIDGDDVALPDRFTKQVHYLKNHPECDVIATTATLIDDKGRDIGVWPADRKTITHRQIKNYLPTDNCLVHPSAIFKTEVLKKFRYSSSQALGEDYDLWLRLIADGKQIHKLNEPLTLHRILSSSFTRTRSRNGYYKIMKIKQQFFIEQCKMKKISVFSLKTLFLSFIDLIIGTEKEFKYFFSRTIKRKS